MTLPGEPDPGTVRDAISDALSAALGAEYVTRWVAVVETIGATGERSLWTAGGDQTAWDTLGLIRFAEIRAAATVDVDDVDPDPGD